MDNVSGRPVFTCEQIDKELKQVVLLDRILAESGALTFNHLNDVVSKIDKGNNFKTLDDLVTFIEMRSNVFEVSFDLVKNRSQEFREMFGYLVNFLCDADQSKRNVKIVFQIIIRFNGIVIHEVGNTEEKIYHFLEKHRKFFILCRNDMVMLNPTCLEIPSAWERRALPTYKNAIRYDKSIVLDGIGKVVSAVSSTGYIKIEIIRGPWTTQTVFGLSKNVSNEVNLANKYPVGTLVKILAYRAYKAAHPWTARKVVLVDERDNIWCVGETGRMDKMLEKYQYVLKDRSLFSTDHTTAVIEVGHDNNIVTPEIANNKSFNSSPNRKCMTFWARGNSNPRFMMKSVNGEAEAGRSKRNSVDTKMEINSNYCKFYSDVIQDEIKKGREVDECLRNGPKTFRQIFDRLIEGDTFAYYSYMVDFIVVRSHLYEVLENRVWMRSCRFRTEMLKFLRYIDEKSKENITINTLRKLINANDGDFMQELLSYAENADTFLKFIEKHVSLIELAEALGEQFVFLRGTYISHCNIFIPKFHFPRSLSNY
ncbi:unnamed protein product [Cercopithifilaria johnstoni]|uniref:Uncharacterized protein n=1 Tax=Cercopithifilaria johnstoni TaxID=2874296 RepID=A0A8J2LWZ9_9BILA|nr:unnamed protein product [Cercopithifilaria johnstoni]